MVDAVDAKRHSVAIRGEVEAMLTRYGWNPKAAVRDAEEFAAKCQALLRTNGHSEAKKVA